MSVAFRPFDLDEYRKSVQAMSDAQLIQEGKKMKWLSGDGTVMSTRPSALDQRLKICREEWRKRHPRSQV